MPTITHMASFTSLTKPQREQDGYSSSAMLVERAQECEASLNVAETGNSERID